MQQANFGKPPLSPHNGLAPTPVPLSIELAARKCTIDPRSYVTVMAFKVNETRLKFQFHLDLSCQFVCCPGYNKSLL